MNLVRLVTLLLLGFGGGGFLLGGVMLGLGEVAIILLISFIFFLFHGFQIKG